MEETSESVCFMKNQRMFTLRVRSARSSGSVKITQTQSNSECVSEVKQKFKIIQIFKFENLPFGEKCHLGPAARGV